MTAKTAAQFTSINTAEEMNDFAHALADELGFIVTEEATQSFMPWAYLEGEIDGTTVRLSMKPTNPSQVVNTKVTIYGLSAVAPNRNGLAYDLDKAEATVSVSRGVATIAKELHRRLFPAQIANIRTMNERIAKAEARENTAMDKADQVEAAFAGMQVRRNNVDKESPTIYASANGYSAQVEAAYGRMTLNSLSVEQMVAVAKVLAATPKN